MQVHRLYADTQPNAMIAQVLPGTDLRMLPIPPNSKDYS